MSHREVMLFNTLERFTMFKNHFVSKECLHEYKKSWKHTLKHNKGIIDKELIKTLCLLNKIKNLSTVFSCQGHHLNDNFYIAFICNNNNGLKVINAIHKTFSKTLSKKNRRNLLIDFRLDFSYLISLNDQDNYPVFIFRIFNNDENNFKETKKVFYKTIEKIVKQKTKLKKS